MSDNMTSSSQLHSLYLDEWQLKLSQSEQHLEIQEYKTYDQSFQTHLEIEHVISDETQLERIKMFICSICTLIVLDPLECSGCDNLFCRGCISVWLE